MNTYLREAERIVMGMDIEERAMLAARSTWQSDEAEQNSSKFRKEAEKLYDFWCTQLTKSLEQYSDLDIKELELQFPNGLHYANVRNGLTDEQCKQRQWEIERLSQQKSKVLAVVNDIREAIAYLKAYLYPLQEGDASQAETDLPFTSNFGMVAQESISPAMSLLKILLRKQGKNMYHTYELNNPSAKISEMNENQCWDLLEMAIAEEGFDEGERSDVEELWGMYYNNNFQAVLETVKEYMLN
jgi:hypothetical protein